MLDNLSDGAKHTLDALAGVVALGAIAQILPPIAAVLSIFWLAVQIYDRFLGHKRPGRE